MVLHNMCVNAHLPFDEDNDEDGDGGSDEDAEDDNMDGAAFDRRVQQGAVLLGRNLAHQRFGHL